MSRRPNILLIVTDQERSWGTLPPSLVLPARERLRARGVNFPNYHVNAVACSPSRSNIYTGQHIQRTRVFDNANSASCINPVLTPTLGQMLQCEGYCTAYAGKWHLSGSDDFERLRPDFSDALLPCGFDFYFPYHREGDGHGGPHAGHLHDGGLAHWTQKWLCREALEIAQTRPWFLALNLINPHDIMFFDATGRQRETQLARWAQMKKEPPVFPYTEDLRFDLPENFSDDFSGRPTVHRAFFEDAALAYGELPLGDLAAWRRYQNYYFNCLRDVDIRIGKVLDALVASGAEDRTIVVFTSDHGEMGGAHGLRGKGPIIYRENFCVPLVIVHPDIGQPVDSNALVSAVDLAPTMLALSGLGEGERRWKYPNLVGCDVSGSLEHADDAGIRAEKVGGILLNSSVVHASNPTTTRRQYENKPEFRTNPDAIKFGWPRDAIDPDLKSFLRGVYDGRYRFARYFRPDDHQMPRDWESLLAHNELELYDTFEDPGELDNLAQQPGANRNLILELNRKLNALIALEAGIDDGSYMGPE